MQEPNTDFIRRHRIISQQLSCCLVTSSSVTPYSHCLSTSSRSGLFPLLREFPIDLHTPFTMRLRRYSPVLLPSVLLLIPAFTAAQGINCEHVLVDGVSFNFEALDGPHSVMTSKAETAMTFYNTTYTINLCHSLKRTKGVPPKEDCPSNSKGKLALCAWICNTFARVS